MCMGVFIPHEAKKKERFLKIMENKVLVETSARHIHLTAEAVEVLYGKGAELIVKKMLSQPGQFATANDKTFIFPIAITSKLYLLCCY